MIINTDRNGSTEGFEKTLRKTASTPGVEGLLILACEGNQFTPRNLDPILKDCKIPLFGGVFTEIMLGSERLSRGTIVAALSQKPEIVTIPSLSNRHSDFETLIEKQVNDPGSARTIFVFVDGYSKRINAFIEAVFNVFGLEVNYLGGGAGSTDMKQKPCLITNQGLLRDSGVLVCSGISSQIGVSHGWEKIGGPFRVTKSDRNTIMTLDWQPAFEVYRQEIARHSGLIITGENFFEIAKRYPFGISRLENGYIVRDPFLLDENEGSLTCIGEVSQESFIHLLHGDMSSVIASAGTAAALSRASDPGASKNGTTILMDCVSRILFLEDDFQKELEAIFKYGSPLIGAATIGEIANDGREFLEFYNKTAVVGFLEE